MRIQIKIKKVEERQKNDRNILKLVRIDLAFEEKLMTKSLKSYLNVTGRKTWKIARI